MAERKIGGKTERRPAAARQRILGAVLAAALVLGLVTGIIRGFAGSPGLFLREMERFAPPERTGLPAAEYPGMAAHIADYLAGRKESFQYTLSGPDGGAVLCFHDYELAHMADCRRLIRLDGIVFLGCLAAALTAGLLLFRSRREGSREARRGAKAVLWGLSLLAAGLLLWAAVSFDSLFLTFHRLAFTNDLWLLDPRTDLLIRLMPEQMFVDLGIRGLAAAAAGAALAAAVFFGVRLFRARRNPRRKDSGARG